MRFRAVGCDGFCVTSKTRQIGPQHNALMLTVAQYTKHAQDTGRRVVKQIILTAAMLALISTAQAQGYVTQPGRAPAYAIPRGGGTYVIPGQMPTYITPRGNGTLVMQSPGQRPAYAIPRGDGTYVIPGQMPTYITPRR
jgi:hypothetical protein